LSKAKFILLIFILISIISVTLAETNQSATTDEGAESGGEDVLLKVRITIVSLIFIAISLFLNHFMDDHDGYLHRLLKLQRHYKHYKENGNSFNYFKTNNHLKNWILKDCLLFCVTQMHFGIIAFTLIFCFLSATILLTWLGIEFIKMIVLSRLWDVSIIVAFGIINLILLFQLWVFTRQGNVTARWIYNLEKIKFREECEENLKKMEISIPTPSHRIGRRLTKCRLWLARVGKDGYLNLYTDGGVIIWFIILLCLVYICCR